MAVLSLLFAKLVFAASSIPHFEYMSIRAFPTRSSEVRPRRTNCACICLPIPMSGSDPAALSKLAYGKARLSKPSVCISLNNCRTVLAHRFQA
uniref:Uncharacterized protein n=1 Tax=Arundo donax TaxID=35708 RepID=A0A0A9CEZ8_ARUDO